LIYALIRKFVGAIHEVYKIPQFLTTLGGKNYVENASFFAGYLIYYVFMYVLYFYNVLLR